MWRRGRSGGWGRRGDGDDDVEIDDYDDDKMRMEIYYPLLSGYISAPG